MIIDSLKQFAENKYVNLLSGIILFTTSAIEIINSLEEGEVGAHHGIVIFALVHIIKTLPEFVHGAEEISKIKD